MKYFSKDRILDFELVSPQNTKRHRFKIAVFVCGALVVVTALTLFIIKFTLAKKSLRLDLDIHQPWYLRRAEWQASPAHAIELLDLPVPYVLIGHSATNICTDKYECVKRTLTIQRDHQGQRGWDDIGPNFLVGGNGMVLEGRGANVLGAMVLSWNRVGISIMFLGNYINHEPVQEQFDNVNSLLKQLVVQGVLTSNYTVYGHCQVRPGVITPGPNILNNLHNFEHWDPVNKTKCLRE